MDTDQNTPTTPSLRDLFGDFESESEEILIMPGYDHCIVGVVEQFGRPPIACYDKQKVLLELQRDGMSEEDAEEFWSFNQIGAWVGESTPCFLTLNDLMKRKLDP
jgi:hypothetical protein